MKKPVINRADKTRRKNFNPRKWASTHLKDGGGLPTLLIRGDPHDCSWDYARKCTQCGDTYGSAYLKPDGNWYCPCCHDDIKGPDLLEQIRNEKEPKVLIEDYKRWLK